MQTFEKYIEKWICIACPFQGNLLSLTSQRLIWWRENRMAGAPGYINDCLLTGLQFVYGFESLFFVSRWTMHQLVIFKTDFLNFFWAKFSWRKYFSRPVDSARWMPVHLWNVTESRIQVEKAAIDSSLEKTVRNRAGNVRSQAKYFIICGSSEE